MSNQQRSAIRMFFSASSLPRLLFANLYSIVSVFAGLISTLFYAVTRIVQKFSGTKRKMEKNATHKSVIKGRYLRKQYANNEEKFKVYYR